jgi:hypothetical protein
MTKTVTFPVAMRIFVSIQADDWVRFFINGAPAFSSSVPVFSGIINFPAGTYPIRIDFAENAVNARLEVSFSRINNPDDTVQGCTWDVVQDTASAPSNKTVSNTWMFALDPTQLTGSTSTSYSSGRSCYLEMRGYVDLSGTTRPVLSFWDYWELPSGVSARLEVARYIETVPSAIPPTLNRSALSWNTIAVRNGGTTNHNWTRNAIDLRALVAGDKVTFRFVLTNISNSTGVHRWFIDDLQVLDDPTPPADAFFTIDNSWDLNSRTQMDDFIFDGETMRTLETTFGVPNQVNGSIDLALGLDQLRARGAARRGTTARATTTPSACMSALSRA